MKDTEAKSLVEKTFSAGFDEGAFRVFARNLFYDLDEDKVFDYHGTLIKDSYKDHVAQFKRIGTYTAPDGRKLDVLVVRLKKEGALDRARTMQRNFISEHMKQRDNKDAALVAFYTDGAPEDWRFSFVRMEYSSEVGDDGKVHVATDVSPARRYSFLVGSNEPHHTALQRLWPLLTHEHNKPTLAEIEAAFDIESVTKEFFAQYKELFLGLKDELERLVSVDPKVAAEFHSKSIDINNFSKKLLGQIVFLYFLQKKGWLGVQKDENGAFKPWGTGPKDFLQRLFRGRSHGLNFFNDLLEPLFYEALAIERPTHYYSRFACRIPFLNGGLFEPMNGYNWQEIDIQINNRLFETIFETFDKYNFTVREDEPLDKEVAVDPEMLGKVFENLLEVTDRKSKGAFYTPREIVHYMCQESLIHYLVGRLPDVGHDNMAYFIRRGQSAVENDAAKARGSQSYRFRMPVIMANASELDKALAGIRICDPAIGSGAFPVGMLNEVVNARQTLTAYLGASGDRTPYEFKRHAITECIYGVDIDEGAIEIAKLRLWLSLVVDEDDFETIRPLPNLDFKIVRGNSLQKGIRDAVNTQLVDELESLKKSFTEETRPGRKLDLRSRIERLTQTLTGGKPVFDYQIQFSEVFQRQSGFDIVIANPPYVRHEAIKAQKPALNEAFPNFFCGTADLYTYFYKRGLEILRPNGHLCYIAPNKFMKAGYGKKTRTLLGYDNRLKLVVDFCELPVFDASTDPAILLEQKSSWGPTDSFGFTVVKSIPEMNAVDRTVAERCTPYRISSLSGDGWNLESTVSISLVSKMARAGIVLNEYVDGRFYRGILTGYNEAFIIDADLRERLINTDPKNAEIIKPWLDGHDIRRWHSRWMNKFVIFTRGNFDLGRYPSIETHLMQFKEDLTPKIDGADDKGRKPGPYSWFQIQDTIAYWEEFLEPKIVFNETSKELHAFVDYSGLFINKTGFIIVSDENEFITGILNSRLMDYYYRCLFPAWGDPWKGGRIQFRKDRMVNVPIANATPAQKSSIADLVSRIQDAPGDPRVPSFENEINRLVYELYNLTAEEIAIVEQTNTVRT